MKIQGINTVTLLRSPLLNHLPGLKCLAELASQGGTKGSSYSKIAKDVTVTRASFRVSLLLGLAGLCVDAYFDWSFPALFIGIVGLFGVVVTGLVYIVHTGELSGFAKAVNDIISVYGHSGKGSILHLLNRAVIHTSVRAVLDEIAELVLVATPDSNEYKVRFGNFCRLHKAAEALHFELGGYEKFFDPARLRIAGQTETKKEATVAS